MTKNATDLIRPTDIIQAVGLLTRLPMPVMDGKRSGSAAAWAYPFAGLIVGVIASVVGFLAQWAGLPDILTALLCLASLIILTGAMHEDGLADTADGLWGGWTRDKRLEIMKDSHIGTYGVLALALSVAARGTALWLLFEQGAGVATAAMISGCMLSRATMPAVMAALPPARTTGLSQSVGSVRWATACIAAALAIGTALLLIGTAAIWAVFWAGMIAWIIALIAQRKIGGQTGDILGAVQQISEIAILFSLVT